MKTLNRNELNENWDKFILEGDLNALSLIYLHFYDQLYSYGLKHSNNKQLVEDTLQSVFLNLIKYRKNISQVNSHGKNLETIHATIRECLHHC